MNTHAVILAGAAAASWSLTQILMKSGLRHMGLVSFALSRLVLGVVLVLAMGVLTDDLVFPGWRLALIAASGGLIDSFLGTALFMLSVRRSPAHIATSLANAAPIWGVIGAFAILGEPLTWTAALAAVLVVAGASLLSWRRRADLSSVGIRAGLGALLAGACWGIAAAVPSKYCIAAGMRPATVQLCMLVASSLGWSLVFFVTRSRAAVRCSPRGILIAVISATTGYLVGWAFWLRALSNESAVSLSPIRGGGMTLFAFVLSMLVFHEHPHLRAFLGAGCILAGIVVVSWFG